MVLMAALRCTVAQQAAAVVVVGAGLVQTQDLVVRAESPRAVVVVEGLEMVIALELGELVVLVNVLLWSGNYEPLCNC